MRYEIGDLLESGLPAIGHGVNLEGVMGSGIARSVREKFPNVYREYREACLAHELKPGGVQPIPTSGPIVFNMATQVRQGADAKYTLLVESAVTAMSMLQRWRIPEFGLPLIGCGIGGLDWERVEYYLGRIQTKFPTEIVIYTLEEMR